MVIPLNLFAFAFYGYVIGAQLKDYKSGYDFAKLGMTLNENSMIKHFNSKVLVISEGCVAHWQLPFPNIYRIYGKRIK